jgi:hypothetical protein
MIREVVDAVSALRESDADYGLSCASHIPFTTTDVRMCIRGSSYLHDSSLRDGIACKDGTQQWRKRLDMFAGKRAMQAQLGVSQMLSVWA